MRTGALVVLGLLMPFLLSSRSSPAGRERAIEPADWATYNYDVLGTRHNVAEKHLNADNAPNLEEKWRFPPKDSNEICGVIHGTPIVVNGHVYFGTTTSPRVYKLAPDGKVKWTYTNADAGALKSLAAAGAGVPSSGFINSPLVTPDMVFIGDAGGSIYALDRFTGKERWKINTRAKPFPGAHSSNCVFAAPILAEGKLVVAGGGFEHAVGANPRHKCCTGRGFVVALEPASGDVVWKYDVGPDPKPLEPPVKIVDEWGEHVFHHGPSTSSVWSTPSFDTASGLVFFGTDAHNAPRQPTADDPRLFTKHSCAVIALDARNGVEKWVTQLNENDVWNYALRAYDPKTGKYKDQSIGDTPKPYTIQHEGKSTRVVGVGCKNGGYYVLELATGKLLAHTPIYTGPPTHPPDPKPHPRMLALPSPMGGLQTGCATDGKSIFTNGIDAILNGTQAKRGVGPKPPTGGRVTCISLDTRDERWRHERPLVKAVGGTPEKPAFTDVGDPVGSGIALANGTAYFTTTVSNRLVALDISNGRVLKEIPLGPVWCGPSVSRGRVYVGSGNTLFNPFDPREGFFPKSGAGILFCFGLPGEDEISRMGGGDE